MHLLLGESTSDKIIVDHVHVTHTRWVGGETTYNLKGGRVKHVHLTCDVTAAQVLLRELQQADSRTHRCLEGENAYIYLQAQYGFMHKS